MLRIHAHTRFISQGEIPLIIDVTSADIMAVLLALKSEVEQHTNATMRMSISRATEAHLIAKDIGMLGSHFKCIAYKILMAPALFFGMDEIAEAGVGVILRNSRPFPVSWRERRMYALFTRLLEQS
jgi:hypothetical protein